MLLHRLAVSRIPRVYNNNNVFPGCESGAEGIINLEPNQEYCYEDAYFIASNNTAYEVEAKFLNPNTMKVTKSVTVNNPLAVTYNESTSYVYSKVKCLTTLSGCKLQIVPFIPTEISYSEDKLHDWDAVAVKHKRQLNYFSTMPSGSFSQKIKYNTQYRVSEKKLTFVTESLTYMNINPSLKKLMNTSNNDNIYLIVRTEKDRPRYEAAQFNGEIFIEIDESRSYIAYIEKGRNYKYNIEGKVELEFLKTGSPPADIEKMLFADDLEVILLGEDAVKTTDQVKEDTKNTADSSSSFPVWAIAVIAVASVIVIVAIIVGVIICVKKC